MEGECKVQMDVTVNREAKKPATQSVKPSSRLTTALLAFTLCLAATAAAILTFKTNFKGPGQDEHNFALHHSLRQTSSLRIRRAAIHLEGKYNKAMNTSVEWKNNVDQSHSQDLRLENNEILIPESGIYFVYSQASFQVNCASSDIDGAASSPLVHVSHTVKRKSKSYGSDTEERTILHSVRTTCQKTVGDYRSNQENWYTAVYMGAVFNLKKGDRLKTVMEKKMLLNLEDDSGKTFFGVFAL
ncbi:tumor necrosis factor a (TNF superfamily, member 2) [Echeneis naucrates]|uniref:tumor necrosis factor a (TNF superfamily, member 2) n=1 Tax=Echeneis naucrates TaxID=173247 RepID=UPI0011140CD8|nr:tumor necrosis factor-like [Echeneis naucrates]